MAEFVPVPGYRARLETVPGGVELVVPSRRNYFVIAFLCLWLCGWFFGEFNGARAVSSPVAHGEPGFMVFWLIGWTIGGVFAVTTILWNLAGAERVVLGNDEFLLRREIFGIGFGKRYALRNVTDLRVVETDDVRGPFGMSTRNPFGAGGGPFAFDYGSKTVRFGAGVEVAEAKYWRAKLIASKPGLESRDTL